MSITEPGEAGTPVFVGLNRGAAVWFVVEHPGVVVVVVMDATTGTA